MEGENNLSENQFGHPGSGRHRHKSHKINSYAKGILRVLTYAMHSIPRGGRTTSRQWCVRRFQTQMFFQRRDDRWFHSGVALLVPGEAKKRLVASVVHSKLLYAAPICVSILDNHAIHKWLSPVQRGAAIRIISAYQMMSTSTVLVLASVPPIDLLARERLEAFCSERRIPCGNYE